MLIVTTTEGETGQPRGHPSQETFRQCKEVCRTSDLEIERGTRSKSRSSPVTTHSSSMAPACDGSMPSRIESVSRGREWPGTLDLGDLSLANSPGGVGAGRGLGVVIEGSTIPLIIGPAKVD
jgi:hypothetical protein